MMGFIEELINFFYNQYISRKCRFFGQLSRGSFRVSVKLRVMKKTHGLTPILSSWSIYCFRKGGSAITPDQLISPTDKAKMITRHVPGDKWETVLCAFRFDVTTPRKDHLRKSEDTSQRLQLRWQEVVLTDSRILGQIPFASLCSNTRCEFPSSLMQMNPAPKIT